MSYSFYNKKDINLNKAACKVCWNEFECTFEIILKLGAAANDIFVQVHFS